MAEVTCSGRARAPQTAIRVSDCTICGEPYVTKPPSRRQICRSTTCRNKRSKASRSAESLREERRRYRATRKADPRLRCVECDTPFGRAKDGKYCSLACWGAAQSKRPASGIVIVGCPCGCGALKTFGLWDRRAGWRCVPLPPVDRTRLCESCGEPFELMKWQGGQQRFCKAGCRGREARTRRRARKKKAPGMEPVFRAKIYERDGWRCQICRRLVKRGAMPPHPKAPVLDHIIPLAQGGPHQPANVQLACFRCNCLKGDRTAPAGDQLRLIG